MHQHAEHRQPAGGVETVEAFGVDPNKFDLQPVSELGQFKTAITTLCKKLMAAKREGRTTPKILVGLDSMGMLSSEKEVNDAMTGNTAADFTRPKTIRSVFRLITSDLTGLDIPFVYTNHTYASIGMFPSINVSGGQGQVYSPSVMLNFTKAKLKSGDVQTGIVLTAKPLKNRLAKPGEIKLFIDWAKGMNEFVGMEHYATWDVCGIQRGQILGPKEYAKLTDAEKEKAKPFPEAGEGMWFFPKDTAQKIIVKHLGTGVPLSEYFTAKVFTHDVLTQINEKCIHAKFKYGVEESAEIEAFLDDNDDNQDEEAAD